MSFTQVALTGTIEASPGVALASATVTATLSGEMSDGVTVVTPLGVSARTAADGTFSLTVPANDDTICTIATANALTANLGAICTLVNMGNSGGHSDASIGAVTIKDVLSFLATYNI